MAEAGRIVLIDPGADKPLLEVGTLQCVHCHGHFPFRPGSGDVRGFCQRCCGPVCGPTCVDCIPAEQLIENIEHGRPLDYKPILVPVSFG